MTARKPATGTMTPRLTPAEAMLLAQSCGVGGAIAYVGYSGASKLLKLGLLVAEPHPIYKGYNRLDATPLGRWRALGGKRPAAKGAR